MTPPLLGTAVVGDGGATAALDAFGSVVNLRFGPGGPLAGSARQLPAWVPEGTLFIPKVKIGRDPPQRLWRADAIQQRYLRDTNVLRTVARFGRRQVVEIAAARGDVFGLTITAPSPNGSRAFLEVPPDVGRRCVGSQERGWVRTFSLLCGGRPVPAERVDGEVRRIWHAAAAADRRWLRTPRSLSPGAPQWADRLYRRSLLALHTLTDSRTGAVAAGAREGWAYVWPRDASAVALALDSAGLDADSRRVAHFLLDLDLRAAARFGGRGQPVPGRDYQGDAAGWTAAAATAVGIRVPPMPSGSWRGLPDYQEKTPGDLLGNAISAELGARFPAGFLTQQGLVRVSGEPGSGLDSAAAWAVRPFTQPALFKAARMTMLRLTRAGGRFGILPGEDWPEQDPWSAPTAWTAWSLAALSRTEDDDRGALVDRRAALRLLDALRRSTTPTGLIPERVDAVTGIPRSTTPLAWSHAFAILALRELWPN